MTPANFGTNTPPRGFLLQHIGLWGFGAAPGKMSCTPCTYVLPSHNIMCQYVHLIGAYHRYYCYTFLTRAWCIIGTGPAQHPHPMQPVRSRHTSVTDVLYLLTFCPCVYWPSSLIGCHLMAACFLMWVYLARVCGRCHASVGSREFDDCSRAVRPLEKTM